MENKSVTPITYKNIVAANQLVSDHISDDKMIFSDKREALVKASGLLLAAALNSVQHTPPQSVYCLFKTVIADVPPCEDCKQLVALWTDPPTFHQVCWAFGVDLPEENGQLIDIAGLLDKWGQLLFDIHDIMRGRQKHHAGGIYSLETIQAGKLLKP